jgi:hypothetical protein
VLTTLQHSASLSSAVDPRAVNVSKIRMPFATNGARPGVYGLTRWTAITATLIAFMLIAGAMSIGVGSADANCTRYAGYPRGIWYGNQAQCAARTGWDTFTGQGGGYSTSSTALRGDNVMNSSSQTCPPKRHNIWYYYPATGQTESAKSTFCSSNSCYCAGSNGQYAYSECALWIDNGGSGSISAECHTDW